MRTERTRPIAGAAALLLAVLGCGEPAAKADKLAQVEAAAPQQVAQLLEESGKPAQVQNAVKETALTSVTLSERAAERLGIEHTPVQRRAVGRARTLGGELVAPQGHALVVSAPQAGTLVAARPGGRMPQPGSFVKEGEALFRLLLLPPGDLSRAQEEVSLGEVRLDDARTKLRRAAQLLKDRAGSMRQLEDAQVELANAEKGLEAARGRVALLSGKALQSGNLSGLTPLVMRAPQDGVIQRMDFGRGQLVPAGAALVEIVRMDPLWVRVPLYVGDLASVDPGGLAAVRDLTASASSRPRMAKPISAPLTADARAASADLFYEIPNPDGGYRPGQRVSVTLTLRGSEESLVVPWSAVVIDVNGGTWVYEAREHNQFVRRRVSVRHVSGDLAVLAHGPEEGTPIVTAGVPELFGTEFGTGK